MRRQLRLRRRGCCCRCQQISNTSQSRIIQGRNSLVRLSQKGLRRRRRRRRHQRRSINNEKSVWYVIIYFYLITRQWQGQRLRRQTADRSCVGTHTHTLVHLHHRHLCCFAFSRDSHVGYLIKRSSLVAPPQSHQCDAPVSPVCACACVLQLHQVTSTLTHDLVVPPLVRNPFLN